MSKVENTVPGCSNRNMFTGVCNVVFKKKNIKTPTLAVETLIDPPGLIEGPPSQGVKGLLCMAGINNEPHEKCSHFRTRKYEDNLRDQSI